MSMGLRKRYCLLQDDDGHWYVVPVEQEKAFHQFVEQCGRYWGGPACELVEEPPRLPEGICEVGGAPSLVTFERPEIDGEAI